MVIRGLVDEHLAILIPYDRSDMTEWRLCEPGAPRCGPGGSEEEHLDTITMHETFESSCCEGGGRGGQHM